MDEVEVVAEAEDEVEVRGCAEVCRATAGKATTGQSDLCAAKAQQATFTKQNGSRGWTTQNCNICGKKLKATEHSTQRLHRARVARTHDGRIEFTAYEKHPEESSHNDSQDKCHTRSRNAC